MLWQKLIESSPHVRKQFPDHIKTTRTTKLKNVFHAINQTISREHRTQWEPVKRQSQQGYLYLSVTDKYLLCAL